MFSVLAVACLLLYRDVYPLIFSIAFTCKPGSAKLKRDSAAWTLSNSTRHRALWSCLASRSSLVCWNNAVPHTFYSLCLSHSCIDVTDVDMASCGGDQSHLHRSHELLDHVLLLFDLQLTRMRFAAWASASGSWIWTTLARWASTSSWSCPSCSRTRSCSASSTSSTPTATARSTLKVRLNLSSSWCQQFFRCRSVLWPSFCM